ncbi:MAG: 2-oxo-4-hydroxy-4-carboxy-5-ureidoimidazoline decarboxylase [Actinomycetota bacterium]|nr:2-oxo-4-hydroxy-4-carboxy-5-ureidoimidazoline decarboxylase [Actinomycetota bacterium]
MTTSSVPGLAGLNALPADDAQRALLGVCTSPTWARAVTTGRPYHSVARIFAASDAALAALTDSEIDAALAGHPRIGERAPASSDSGGFSDSEQSGLADATEALMAALHEGNRKYEDRFGQVYLVCATGRGGEELLAMLLRRLGNDEATERRVVREELRKINRLRLGAMMAQ